MKKAVLPLLVIGLAALLGACQNESPAGKTCENTLVAFGTYVQLPAGEFNPDFAQLYPEESRRNAVSVAAFKLLAHEVTNKEFAEFVEATGYVSDAEKVGADPAAAGSALFSQRADQDGKWELMQGATWRQPDGPGSDLIGRDYHPVIHVSHNDATNYARWRGGRLPSEVEWEYAASLGLAGNQNRAAGAYDEQGMPIANTWQGLFPVVDSGDDGYTSTAPVACYAANSIGLYDMIGNVWEWTDTVYAPQRHTIKGGSFLCARNYCRRYRPEARQGHESDFSTNHIGFRIIKD
ncbi:MAG: formylglycine-generating enzyme family protein [Pseudomonadota bacterium]